MFLRISEKITGRKQPGNSPQRLALVAPTIVAALLFYSPSVWAAEPFERGSFNQIEFSDSCAKKQWTVSPEDNALELLVAPKPEEECRITLPFYFEQNIQDVGAIAFEARSTRPGAYLRVGVQEKPGLKPIFSSRFPSEGLGRDWKADGLRIRRLQENWYPKQLSAIHFVVAVPSNSHFGPKDRVLIRNIRFAGSVFASPATSTLESATPMAPATALSPTPALTAPLPVKTHSPLHALGKWLIGLIVFAVLIWAYDGRSQRRRILSPLYEINMRTWKTQKDIHDVVEFGGFSKISTADLKTIKQGGFNAIWLMGIWEVGPKVREISTNYAADFKGSPFAIYDYTISQDLGTEQTFQDVVKRAHGERLSVIIDFVPNHMGLDSAWLNDHPEYFIHRVLDDSEANLADDDLKQRYPGFFPYRTPAYPMADRRVPKTLMIAYGKDPYFYPWIDTAQLDYAHPGLRQRMIDILCQMAKRVDGVRCDMAMLTLREQVKNHRHPEMSWETFNQLMPNEFWTEAIQAAKRVNPNFVFIAETYWSMEGYLQDLGFDYTYNKPLYEALCSAVHSGNAEGFMNFLRLLGTDFLKHSVHFLENHDEERAMNALGEERQKPAAVVLCTLPGVALLHQGQLEGKRERLPVQRVIPLHQEPEHSHLHQFYKNLLRLTSLPVFQEGRLIPLYSNNPAFVSYVRMDDHSQIVVIVNTSQQKQSGSISFTPGLRLHSGTQYRLNDLFYSFKAQTAGTIQPFYVYPGAKLMNNGLYIELEAFDAHIFVVEARGAMPATQKALRSTRQAIEEWPLNRVARRFLGAAFTRSSDTHLAANPTGRQS